MMDSSTTNARRRAVDRAVQQSEIRRSEISAGIARRKNAARIVTGTASPVARIVTNTNAR